MEELLSRVLDAHGGLDTWNRVHEAARRGAISPTATVTARSCCCTPYA